MLHRAHGTANKLGKSDGGEISLRAQRGLRIMWQRIKGQRVLSGVSSASQGMCLSAGCCSRGQERADGTCHSLRALPALPAAASARAAALDEAHSPTATRLSRVGLG